jgi:hypothetical protein
VGAAPLECGYHHVPLKDTYACIFEDSQWSYFIHRNFTNMAVSFIYDQPDWPHVSLFRGLDASIYVEE